MRKLAIFILALVTMLMIRGPLPANAPYNQKWLGSRVLLAPFGAPPKHLDPALSYSENEWILIEQILTTPLQYHYLLQPAKLIPLVAERMPQLIKLNEKFEPTDGEAVYTDVVIDIRDADYAPHPALFLEHGKNPNMNLFAAPANLYDLPTGSRKVHAKDFVYQIKRLADPKRPSPIFSLMSKHIVGLERLRADLAAGANIDSVPFQGAWVVSPTRYVIRLQGNFPQFIYWLSMPFFAPTPVEAVKFYDQDVLRGANITLDTYPVGSGPFYLAQNKPAWRMVLKRNPLYFDEAFPCEGTARDEEILTQCGKKLPMLDAVLLTAEREAIPSWNKFMQGYYDRASILDETFSQAVVTTPKGLAASEEMRDRGIQLKKSVVPSIFYFGFNVEDKLFSGEQGVALRRAIRSAFDTEQMIELLYNGRGVVASTFVPPGVYGYKSKPSEFNLDAAREYMKQAGYPGGIDPKTKRPLVITMDLPTSGRPDLTDFIKYTEKQFKKIGIELVIELSDYSRYQDKMLNADMQMFFTGWNADYPDPENFYKLFTSEESSRRHGGHNHGQFSNPEYDATVELMTRTPDSAEREVLLDKLEAILDREAIYFGAYYPITYYLQHEWVNPGRLNVWTRNTLKYRDIDYDLRLAKVAHWNPPSYKGVAVFALIMLLLTVPFYIQMRRMHLARSRRGKP